MIYQDYMRRKMHNVVKLDTAEGYPLTVYSCANTNLKDYTIYGNTGGVGDKFEPYNKYKIPITVTGKNLFDIDTFLALNGNLTYYSKNENGELVQVKGDFRDISDISTITTLPAGTYTLSISNTDVSSFYIIINGKSNGTGKASFTLTKASDIGLKFYERAETILGYIQIELGSSATAYEPYHEPVTTNIYRDAQLVQGESINYKSDNLPDITLEKGTNTITANTEVKPSSIKIKYLKK